MEELLTAFSYSLSAWPFFLILVGTSVGVFMGAIPGLSGTMTIALCLPLTFFMTPPAAISLLVSIYVGAISGGLITATLLKMPGTEAALMTTLDGYPLAASGSPGRALGLGITASFIGGVVSWLALLLLSKPLSIWATKFTPFDYFALVFLALVLVAVISKGTMLKGLIAASLGALLAIPGMDISSGMPRLTFGSTEMNSGFEALPMFIGLFALGTVFSDLGNNTAPAKAIEASRKGIMMSLGDFKKHWVNLLRSSSIGTVVGILPGVGAVIGSMVAYTVSKSVSKRSEEYGTGCEEGIIASESANNATVGGALIPLVSLGIPGSLNDVLLLAALMIHSIQPGPLLYINNPELVYTLITSTLISNILMFIIMILSIKWIAKVSSVPKEILYTLVIVASIIGAYAYGNSFFDVWVMLGFAVIGFAMDKFNYPKGPLAIGFILAPLAEEKLRTGLQITAGSYSPLYTDALPLTLLTLAFVMVVYPYISQYLPFSKSSPNTKT